MIRNKINIVSYSFNQGGAAIAAKKFSQLLEETSYDVTTISQDSAGFFMFTKRIISYLLGLLDRRENSSKHALNLFSYPPLVKEFKKNSGLFHFHWISNDTLSVFDYYKIPRGSIMTLHDEWLYCATEHYYNIMPTNKLFVDGYPKSILTHYSLNLKYLVWSTKYKSLSKRDDIIYTVPSKWMYDRAIQSKILKNSHIRILPNPIDTSIFKPLSQDQILEERLRRRIDQDDFVFIFGAVDSNKNPLKGGHLLLQALDILSDRLSINIKRKIKIIIFGSDEIKVDILSTFLCISVGHVKDPLILSRLYAISDCLVTPSLVESFGQVPAEAQACGTPAIAFESSGLKDVIIDSETGLLAKPFSVDSLANCMFDFLHKDKRERGRLSLGAREHIESNFSYAVVRRKYLDLLREAAEIKQKIL